MISTGTSKFCGDPVKLDVIWQALRPFPNGATAIQLAEKLGWKPSVASQRLGKLAMYDIIDRVPIHVMARPGHATRQFRYSIKRHAHV